MTAVIAGALLVGSAVPASAATDLAAGNWWYDNTGVREAQATVTGDGVTIAVVDSSVNVEAPALVGANIRQGGVDACPDGTPVQVISDDPGSRHGTDVSTVIVGNGQPVGGNPGIQGVAPGAEVLVYSLGTDETDSGESWLTTPCPDDSTGYMVSIVQDAVASGADILILTGALNGESATALLQAIKAGVIVIAGNPNDSVMSGPPNPLSPQAYQFNGVVSVENFGPEGERDDPVVGPWVSIVAPGGSFLTYQPGEDLSWSEPMIGGASNSLAMPFVAGALALVMEAYPEATPNQVLQSLVHTASHAQPDPVHTDEEGWGRIDVPRLMATDPTQFPDENPLIRDDGIPAPAMYEEGVFSDEFGPYPLEPVTPGDESAADGQTGAGPLAGLPVLPIALAALGVLVVIGVVVLIVVLATRRRGPTAPGR
ncbi:peptidase S8 and S53 subtilisin kexin sedolisin [Microbacterium sp. XT11]|nr:peptidase S8 and S53 subtilisin kexin sedolisin [Microbacterium sp. XT11]